MSGRNEIEPTAERPSKFSDLQHEIAGRDVGRQIRHLGARSEDVTGEKRKARLEAATQRVLTALEYMLQSDAAFARKYEETNRFLQRAEHMYDSVSMKAYRNAHEASDRLIELAKQAGRLPDDTAVFRSKTGDVYTIEGRKLDAAEIADVTWSDNPVSWEAYQEAKQDFDRAIEAIDELETYQREVLQPSRDRLEDHEDPVTTEEMDQIQRDVLERAPAQVRKELQPDAPVADVDARSNVAVPRLS